MTRKQFLKQVAAAAVASGTRVFGETPSPGLPSTIRVGIIGLAGHFSEITEATKQMQNLRVTAISDPSSESLKRAARSAALRDARQFTNYEALLHTEMLDLVAICGENGPRAGIVQACARRNLPIIAEKPLALTLPELADVKRVVKRHHVPLTLLLPMRCYPVYLAMQQIVQSGQIGQVVSMDAQKSYQLGERPEWMKSRRNFGGTIPYVAIHMLDLMRWISGREFLHAAAFHSNVGYPDLGEMENNAALIVKLDNGGNASMRMDYLRPATAKTHGDDRLRIVGTKGIVEFKEQKLTLLTRDQPLAPVTQLPPAKSLVIDFVESIYLGKPHIIPLTEIYRISEVVLKIRAAADTGRTVSL